MSSTFYLYYLHPLQVQQIFKAIFFCHFMIDRCDQRANNYSRSLDIPT